MASEITETTENHSTRNAETSNHRSPVIFSVAEAFLASEQQFYIPNMISIGPYHFGKTNLRSKDPHKYEAVRRMEERILRIPSPGNNMRSFVEEVAKDINMKEFYDKELSYSARDLAWILTQDSCFLFEFLLGYVNKLNVKDKKVTKCIKKYEVKGRYDAVLNIHLYNPIWKNILYDLVLFENQIPLSLLESLLAEPEIILGHLFDILTTIHTYTVFAWGMNEPYEKQDKNHFLKVLYRHHVGSDLKAHTKEAFSFTDTRMLSFGWTKFIFTRCGLGGRVVQEGIPPVEGNRCALQSKESAEEFPLFKVKLPSAAELKKKGVNLCALPSPKRAENIPSSVLRCVRFDETTSTLYLPEVKIDHFRHALLRNFIALECTSQNYSPWPVTSFASFMNELVDSEEDVAVLSEANIIKNLFGSNKEAAECFNALTRRQKKFPKGCKPIEDARKGLHGYLKRTKKILLHEFLSIYFEKPWSFAISIGASLLLLMTVLQVFCLFHTCNRIA